MLPLVRAIVSDLARLTREVIERHQRLEHVRAGRRITSGDPYDEELAQIEHELAKDRARLNEYAEELRQLGVEPKSAVDGIVDFPAVIDGALAFLCWKLGEPEVLFWHPLHSGFAGRQPLTADAAVEADAFERDA
jgi:hypothetical protein